MKTRNGFVSNSSSSSFIVIADTIDQDAVSLAKQTMDRRNGNEGLYSVKPSDGKSQYGWEWETTDETFSKMIFCFLQARYCEENEDHSKMEMLNRVLGEIIGAKNIVWDFEEDEGWIDHQSAAFEGENIEMFENEDTLARFIFGGPKSYIRGGNDNENDPYYY